MRDDNRLTIAKRNVLAYRNILLVQLGDIGDVVLTTPTVRAVKEAYPDALVSIIVRKPYGSLLRADPALHKIIEIEKFQGNVLNVLRNYVRFVAGLRSARYDLVIDLRTGDRGAIMTYLTGAEERVGRSGTEKQFWHDFLFTTIVRNAPSSSPPVHPGADQSLRIVRTIGIDTLDSEPRLYITPEDHVRAIELLLACGVDPGSRWATLNPFSRWKYKEWDIGKWGQVVDHLWGQHRIPTVSIGAPEEAAGCQEIVRGREGRAFNLAGKTTLGELAAVIAMSSIHLGVDSAAPHIASALGTPTVTIHGPSDWRSWRTIGEHHGIVVPSLECVPCSRTGCEDAGRSLCLEQLAPEAVIEAFEERMRNLL